jgi:intracellular septation protein
MSNPEPSRPHPLLIDLGPIVVFVLAYNILERIAATKANAVYIATGIFIAVTLAAIVYSKLRFGRIPPVLLVTGIFVTAFGGLAIWLQDPSFIERKPTFVYCFYASVILVSVAIGQNVWRLLFGHLYVLPDRIWKVLALRWAGFFVFMAVLNEILRARLDFDGWLNSRPWVAFPLIFAFALANAPLVMKHHAAEADDATLT